ncbi:BnaC04g48030D [Brassica napus]|uniref:(rape) hypothetical protein n=1 Tax=Brassica napus TaxID=3708 RepID=A0A078FNS0_BRANA|nr:unnamed protein product [Brassica napus]CDY14806.1 BnaC04g48030D [Brassica napus]
MGTREVYEEKLRRGNLDYDPTMIPGLGSARCPRCLSLLNPNPEKGEWTLASVLHDAAAVVSFGLVLSFPLVMFWFGTTVTCISFFDNVEIEFI